MQNKFDLDLIKNNLDEKRKKYTKLKDEYLKEVEELEKLKKELLLKAKEYTKLIDETKPKEKVKKDELVKEKKEKREN